MPAQTLQEQSYDKQIAKELQLNTNQVAAVIKLFEEDCTIPFIARYRKEATGSLDEVQIIKIRERLTQLTELDKRRDAIVKSLLERELLNSELQQRIEKAATLTELEDIYLPFVRSEKPELQRLAKRDWKLWQLRFCYSKHKIRRPAPRIL